MPDSPSSLRKGRVSSGLEPAIDKGTAEASLSGKLPDQYIHVVCGSLVVIAVTCTGFTLIYLQDVLKPFTYGIIFMYLLSPVVTFLTIPVTIRWPNASSRSSEDVQPLVQVASSGFTIRSGKSQIHTPGLAAGTTLALPQVAAVVLAMSIAIVFMCFMSSLIISNLVSLQDNYPKYHDEAMRIMQNLMKTLERMNVHSEDLEKMVYKWVKDIPFPSILESLMTACMSMAEHSVMTILFTAYLLLTKKPIQDSDYSVHSEIDRQVRQYLVLKTFLSTLLGVLVFVFLWFLEVDFAFMFGLITFIANYIPNVGALMATMLPLPLVLLDPHMTFASRVLAFLLPFLTHAFVGNVVEPMVFGDSFDLHPVVVLFSLAMWGALWGISGMILSVPLTAVLRIVMKQLSHPYAVLLTNLLQGKFPQEH